MKVKVPIRIEKEQPALIRRIRRKRAKRPAVWVLAKLLLYVAAAALFTRFAIAQINRPLQLLKDQMKQSAALTARLEKLKKENRVLQRRLSYLQTERGKTQAARQLGYVKPGEVILVLPSDLALKDGKANRR